MRESKKSHVHGIDQRAKDKTFDNQSIFWLSPAEICEIYDKKNKTLNQSLIGNADNSDKNLTFMQGGIKAYSAGKNLEAGQYVVPFSFKLPDDIPGTYHLGLIGENGQEYPLRICYTVEMFIDTDSCPNNAQLQKCFYMEHEFEVREFTFTDKEVQLDVEAQRLENKVKTLFKTQTVLKPMFQGNEKDKEVMEQMRLDGQGNFYENLQEYFEERGQPIENEKWTA